MARELREWLEPHELLELYVRALRAPDKPVEEKERLALESVKNILRHWLLFHFPQLAEESGGALEEALQKDRLEEITEALVRGLAPPFNDELRRVLEDVKREKHLRPGEHELAEVRLAGEEMHSPLLALPFYYSHYVEHLLREAGRRGLDGEAKELYEELAGLHEGVRKRAEEKYGDGAAVRLSVGYNMLRYHGLVKRLREKVGV